MWRNGRRCQPGGQAAAAGRAFAEYKREAELAFQSFAEQNAALKAENDQLQSGLGNIERLMDGVQEKYETSLQERENENVKTRTSTWRRSTA